MVNRVLCNLGILLFGSIILYLLLSLVFLFPVNQENREKSLKYLEEEGHFPGATFHRAFSYEDSYEYLPLGLLDNYTDGMMVEIATDTDHENESIFVRSAKMFLREGDYQRYWHGYVLILRPLLYFMSYARLREFNALLQLMMVGWILYALLTRRGKRSAALGALVYLLWIPYSVGQALQFSWLFYVTAVGVLLLLYHEKIVKERLWTTVLFLIIGMMTSFLDLLTYPLVTYGVLMVLLLSMLPSGRKVFAYLFLTIECAIWWILGYGVCWGIKWIIGSAVTGDDIIAEGISQVTYRSTSSFVNGVGFGVRGRLTPILLIWRNFSYPILLLPLVLLAVWIIYILVKKGLLIGNKQPAYCLAAFSPIVWIFFVSQHSQNHGGYTFRIYSVLVLAVAAIYIFSEDGGAYKRLLIKNIRQIGVFSVVLGCILCGVLFAFSLREDYFEINGELVSREIPLEDNDQVLISFVPQRNTITEFGIGAASSSGEGDFIWQIYDPVDQILLYEERVPAFVYVENRYYALGGLHWRIKPGKEYLVKVFPDGIPGDKSIVLSMFDENHPEYAIGEIRETKIVGNIEKVYSDGQVLMGLQYHTLPDDKVYVVFVALSVAIFGMAICISVYAFILGIYEDHRRQKPDMASEIKREE